MKQIEAVISISMLPIKNSHEARKLIRNNIHDGYTSGWADQNVQGNLCILPDKYALDFAAFCQRNPKPCPLVGFGTRGDPYLKDLGDIDIRTDLPRYRIWRDGELVAEPKDIKEYWREDLVTFILGCSLSFEKPLLDAGLSLPHIERASIVPMYRTNINCVPAGPFSGPLVVSMRSFPADQVIQAVQITSRFPAVHGAPVHLGDPAQIGIKDLYHPDYGDAPDTLPGGHVPVFWACGVTPQAALAAARPDFCITHRPGCMLITDRLNSEMAAF